MASAWGASWWRAWGNAWGGWAAEILLQGGGHVVAKKPRLRPFRPSVPIPLKPRDVEAEEALMVCGAI